MDSRQWVMVVYLSLFIFGTPVWWFTTAVTKSSLPLEDVRQITSSNSPLPAWQVQLLLLLPQDVSSLGSCDALTGRIQAAVEQGAGAGAAQLLISCGTAEIAEPESRNTVGQYVVQFAVGEGSCSVRAGKGDRIWLSSVTDSQGCVEEVVVPAITSLLLPVTALSTAAFLGHNHISSLSFLQISALHPSALPLQKQVMLRLVHITQKLQPLVRVQAESQMGYVDKLAEVAQWSEEQACYVVGEEGLQAMAAQAGEYDSHTGWLNQWPVHQVVVLLVPPQQQPLRIITASGALAASSSFVVQAASTPTTFTILNLPHSTDSGAAVAEGAREVVSVAVSQLRGAVGLPHSCSVTAGCDPLGFSALDLDSLLLQSMHHSTQHTCTTLSSLQDLLQQLPHMEIADRIRGHLETTIHSHYQAKQLLASGDVVGAHEATQAAYHAANTAFMDPAMLPQIYFPSEHKFAVYSPILLPAFVAVLSGLVREWKYTKAFRKRWGRGP